MITQVGLRNQYLTHSQVKLIPDLACCKLLDKRYLPQGMAVAGDYMVPDELGIGEAINKQMTNLMQTKGGQAFLSYMGEHPELADNAIAASQVGEVFGLKLAPLLKAGGMGVLNEAVSPSTPMTNQAGMLGVSTKREYPPPSNAQKTQLGSSTVPSYIKAADVLGDEGNLLDFGAGRGQGAAQIKADTFEPFAREGFTPTYDQASKIPDNSYNRVTSLNVLNVMPRQLRDEAVDNIGRILAPKGSAVITTRGKDVLTAKGKKGDEPMSIITERDSTYQKGFTQPELKEYITKQLGVGFEVTKLPIKIGQAGVLVKKLSETSPTLDFPDLVPDDLVPKDLFN